MSLEHRIALLRGINVGRAKRIAMADLRALVEDLGYRDVRTLLNSGNVVFNVRGAAKGDPAARIEKALVAQLGISSRVTVITGAELDTIVKRNPLLEIADNPSRLLVAVLNQKTDRKRLEPLVKQDWDPDILAVGDRVAYAWCPQGMVAGHLAETMLRALGDAATTRNWATILKLQGIIQAGRR